MRTSENTLPATASRCAGRGLTQCAFLVLLAVTCPGHAQTFAQMWHRAQNREPGLEAARQNHGAATERTRQAFAATLPQITASVNTNANKRLYTQESSPVPVTTLDRFNSNGRQLNLTHPLFRRANTASLSQAKAQEQQARLQLDVARHELFTALVAAWFDTLAARDAQDASRESVLLTEQLLATQELGTAIGMYGSIQLHEARGKYGQSVADYHQADAEYRAKVARLEQLAGPLPGFAAPQWLRPFMAPADIGALDGWLERAARQGPEVLAALAAVDAARDEVRKQQAQHKPTLDLVVSITGNNQASAGNFPGQAGYSSRQRSAGLQLNIPIYSGGGISAKVREALALQAKAEAEAETATRSAQLDVKQAYAAIVSAVARYTAMNATVESANWFLQSALKGQERGLKTRVDELQARHALQVALRDRSRAHYDMYVNYARLHAAAGTLDGEAMSRIEPDLELHRAGSGLN